MNLNKAMIIGNITRDPDVRQTANGSTVASFSVATNFFWNDPQGQRQERVEFHNIVAWRKLAEICGQYLRKGSKVYVEGRLQTRDWIDKASGQKRYTTEIVAENMIMLDRQSGGGQGQGGARPSGNSQSQGQDYGQPFGNQDNSQDRPSEPVISYDNDNGFAPQASSDDEIKVENIPF